MNKTEIWEIINSYMDNKAILFPKGTAGKTRLVRELVEAKVRFEILEDGTFDVLLFIDSDPTTLDKEYEKADNIMAAVTAFGSSTTEDEGE